MVPGGTGDAIGELLHVQAGKVESHRAPQHGYGWSQRHFHCKTSQSTTKKRRHGEAEAGAAKLILNDLEETDDGRYTTKHPQRRRTGPKSALKQLQRRPDAHGTHYEPVAARATSQFARQFTSGNGPGRVLDTPDFPESRELPRHDAMPCGSSPSFSVGLMDVEVAAPFVPLRDLGGRRRWLPWMEWGPEALCPQCLRHSRHVGSASLHRLTESSAVSTVNRDHHLAKRRMRTRARHCVFVDRQSLLRSTRVCRSLSSSLAGTASICLQTIWPKQRGTN